MSQSEETRTLALTLLTILAVTITSVACGRGGGAPAAAARPDPSGRAAEAAAAKVSDLDQPVSALLAAVCEHGIVQYTCDECRYQVGVVRAGDDLFAAPRGGTLATMKAGVHPLPGATDLNGEVRSNEEKAVYLSPQAAGVVRAILVDLGSVVKVGQVLFEVESGEFRQAKAELLRTAAALELAEATAARERDLFERRICPRKDLLEAEATRREAEAEHAAATGRLLGFGLSREEIEALHQEPADLQSGLMPVRAPFAGTVLERSLSLGAQAQPGDRLLLLADTAEVWVETTVYEREVASLLDAQQRGRVAAEVTVAAYGDRVFKGWVQRVSGTLDEATRTAKARVVADNSAGLLRPGMFARVRLLVSTREDTLALPEEAVLEDEGRSFVFVRATGPYFIRRPVTVGRASEGWVEVRGIAPGDEVVSRGAFLLKSDVLRSKMGAGCAD